MSHRYDHIDLRVRSLAEVNGFTRHCYQRWVSPGTRASPVGCNTNPSRRMAEWENSSVSPNPRAMAFSRSLDHLTGTRTDGEKTDVWVRATVCFRKIDGQWKVTHEHISVPFDMETFKASVHLKP
jgi:hypothetical protein